MVEVNSGLPLPATFAHIFFSIYYAEAKYIIMRQSSLLFSKCSINYIPAAVTTTAVEARSTAVLLL